jgi:hypothetical protein
MWWDGPPWYWDIWKLGKHRKHWNNFDKCNTWGCATRLGTYFHGGAECMCLRCKSVGVVMSRSLKVHGIQMSLWGVPWWICMQNVGAWSM